MDPDAVRDSTLNHWNNRATDDGHIHQAGCVPRQTPKLGDAEREDTREHDGIEKSDRNHAPHCEVTAGQH